MPELPEVETIRQDLKKYLISKKIKNIEIVLERLVKNKKNEFLKSLKNKTVKDIRRVGKLIILEMDNAKYLLVHLKMTGQLVYSSKKINLAGGHSTGDNPEFERNKYSYIIFTFDDDSKLYFNDMRTFGYMKVVNGGELVETIESYGIEPLQKNFSIEKLKEIIKSRKINIKNLLLNQKLVAGIGNIYADEILFRAGVRPDRIANTLSDEEIKKIFNSSNTIIKKAIKARGTTFNNYVDARGKKGSFVKLLQVYGRGGEQCNKCKNKLTKIKLNGRGTVYCSQCQK